MRAALAAFRGTEKPYVHAGGVWVHGAGTDITETTPFTPPELTALERSGRRSAAANARGIGWNPTGPSLLDELRG